MSLTPDNRQELEEIVLSCEHRVWTAVVNRDGDLLANLFSDDYVEITLTGQRVLKQDVVNESPQIDDIRGYTIDSVRFISLSDDTMMLSYHLRIDGTCRGVPLQPRDRWATSIWKLSEERWQCSLFQQSPYQSDVSEDHTQRAIRGSDQPAHIVPMTFEHVPEVLELWSHVKGLVLTYSDNPSDLARYFSDNPQMSFVAIHEERVVGAVLCGHDGRRGYLHHLAVAPDSQNRGIGRALVDACLNRLKAIGIMQCNLFVVEDNAAGKQFWQRDGWSEWPQIRLMSKRLQED